MNRSGIAVLLGVGAIIATAAVAKDSYWRPFMPAIEVGFQNSPIDGRAPRQLIFVYGDRGSDPFRHGTLAPDQRVSGCDVVGRVCASHVLRRAFNPGIRRRQSLKILQLDEQGNRMLGAVTWEGPAHPSRLRIVCDLHSADVRRRCRLGDPVA